MRFALNDLFQTIYCATFGQPQGQDDDMLCPHLIAIGVVHKVRQHFLRGREGSKIEGKVMMDGHVIRIFSKIFQIIGLFGQMG